MAAIFCVRLALGLVLFLPVIWNCLPHTRFVRTQFLTALGLLAVATVSAWDEMGGFLRVVLLSSTGIALVGVLAWTLQPAPAGRSIVVAAIAALMATLIALQPANETTPSSLGIWVNEIASVAILGAAMTAMLVGHSYLIAPGIALTPLLRMLRVLFVTIAVRAAIGGVALAFWFYSAGGHTLTTEIALWLPVRWLVGVVGPLVFGWMATSAAKIRSTQSATGILYVAVVCAILGELLGLLLEQQTGLPL